MTSPLDKYNQTHANRWEILADIPVWEREPIVRWVINALRKRAPSYARTESEYNPQVLSTIQRRERIMFSEFGIDDISDEYEVTQWVNNYSRADNPEIFMLFTELIVRYIRDHYQEDEFIDFGSAKTATSKDVLGVLERILANGSKWKVVMKRGSPSGIVERVNPHLQAIAENAGDSFMNDAWSYAYGLKPDPEKAIYSAQSAIEQIASETGLTNATTGVYGAIIGDIKSNLGRSYLSKAKSEFDKGIELSKSSDAQITDDQFATWFWNGMDLIQKTHPTRHKSKATADFTISVDAARQAILIATLLHEFIARGYITRRSRTKT